MKRADGLYNPAPLAMQCYKLVQIGQERCETLVILPHFLLTINYSGVKPHITSSNQPWMASIQHRHQETLYTIHTQVYASYIHVYRRHHHHLRSNCQLRHLQVSRMNTLMLWLVCDCFLIMNTPNGLWTRPMGLDLARDLSWWFWFEKPPKWAHKKFEQGSIEHEMWNTGH